MNGWMRSHILQLLGCICEFEMLHAYLMLWGLKITDLAGCMGPIAACLLDHPFPLLDKGHQQVLLVVIAIKGRYWLRARLEGLGGGAQ